MQFLQPDQNNKHQIAIFSFLSALIIYIFVFGFELTHFSLSIDEEFNNNILHTVAIGRWGHALLKASIYPEPFIPFFTEILTFILLAASCTVIVKIFCLKSHLKRVKNLNFCLFNRVFLGQRKNS